MKVFEENVGNLSLLTRPYQCIKTKSMNEKEIGFKYLCSPINLIINKAERQITG